VLLQQIKSQNNTLRLKVHGFDIRKAVKFAVNINEGKRSAAAGGQVSAIEAKRSYASLPAKALQNMDSAKNSGPECLRWQG
jgi:hypothetical protein